MSTLSLFERPPRVPISAPTQVMEYKPRDYQQQTVQKARILYDAGTNRFLIVIATGGGKTLTTCELVAAFPELAKHGVLFLVHLDELVWQAERAFKKFHPELNVQVEKAENFANVRQADVVIASVQTLGKNDPTHKHGYSRRLLRLPQFGIIACDEAHHLTVGGSYDRVLNHQGVGSDEKRWQKVAPGQYPLSVGITASPNRRDGQGLNPFYDEVAVDFNMRYLIERGWLCDIEAYKIETGVDIDGVRVRRGEFVQKELQQATNTPERNSLIVRAYQEHGGNSGIAFTAGVEHAYDLAAMFQEAGINAVGMDGTMKKRERAPIFEAFRAGEVEILCADSLLREGFDAPIADTAIMAKPMRSHPVYLQSLGRVVRPYCDVNLPTAEQRLAALAASTKPVARVLDFVDCTDKHPVVTAPCLFGLRKEFDAKGGKLIKDVVERIEAKEEEHPSKRIRDAVSLDDVQVIAEKVDVWSVAEGSPELHAASDFRWMQLREDVVQLEVPAETDRNGSAIKGGEERHYLRAVQDALGSWRVDTMYPSRWNGKVRTKERVKPGTVRFDTMEAAMKAADTHIERNKGSIKRLMERDPAWGRNAAPTSKQVQMLDRMGVYYPKKSDGSPDISKGRASGLISAAIAMKK